LPELSRVLLIAVVYWYGRPAFGAASPESIMDRNLLQHGLEPFGVTETPLVDNLFSITRPDRPATTKPVAIQKIKPEIKVMKPRL